MPTDGNQDQKKQGLAWQARFSAIILKKAGVIPAFIVPFFNRKLDYCPIGSNKTKRALALIEEEDEQQ